MPKFIKSFANITKSEKDETESAIHFQQTLFWAMFKSESGWSFLRFKIEWEKGAPCESQSEFSVLLRAFGKSPFKFYIAYVPLFPVFSKQTNQENAREILLELKENLQTSLPSSTLMIRFDADLIFPDDKKRDEFNKKLASTKLVKAKNDIQPPDSVVIDLASSEEELLAKMKNKWRYNVNLAARKGVEIKIYDAESDGFETAFDEFYKIFLVTAQRDKISIHSPNYYRLLFEIDRKMNGGKTVKLFSAYHEGKMLASIVVLFAKNEAVYLYGASSNEKRQFMPTYLLQWQAIIEAKKYGSARYDLYGIPPNEDKNHPMAGLYRFKTGFGGRKIHRIGSFDLPLKKVYFAFSLLENLRAFYHKKIKKFFSG